VLWRSLPIFFSNTSYWTISVLFVFLVPSLNFTLPKVESLKGLSSARLFLLAINDIDLTVQFSISHRLFTDDFNNLKNESANPFTGYTLLQETFDRLSVRSSHDGLHFSSTNMHIVVFVFPKRNSFFFFVVCLSMANSSWYIRKLYCWDRSKSMIDLTFSVYLH